MQTTALQRQWLLVGASCGCVMALRVAEYLFFPVEYSRGTLTPLTIAEFITMAFAQAGWITLDRRRRDLEVGWWRFGALLLGPIVLWIYFLAEYRLRALYLIPLMTGIYVATHLAAWGIIVCIYNCRT